MSRVRKLVLERQDKSEYRTSALDCSYTLSNGNGWGITSFCAADFHTTTGFRLKPGEKKKITITIAEVA